MFDVPRPAVAPSAPVRHHSAAADTAITPGKAAAASTPGHAASTPGKVGRTSTLVLALAAATAAVVAVLLALDGSLAGAAERGRDGGGFGGGSNEAPGSAGASASAGGGANSNASGAGGDDMVAAQQNGTAAAARSSGGGGQMGGYSDQAGQFGQGDQADQGNGDWQHSGPADDGGLGNSGAHDGRGGYSGYSGDQVNGSDGSDRYGPSGARVAPAPVDLTTSEPDAASRVADGAAPSGAPGDVVAPVDGLTDAERFALAMQLLPDAIDGAVIAQISSATATSADAASGPGGSPIRVALPPLGRDGSGALDSSPGSNGQIAPSGGAMAFPAVLFDREIDPASPEWRLIMEERRPHLPTFYVSNRVPG